MLPLLVIGVMLLGLMYMKFAPGAVRDLGAAGAHAGQYHECTYASEHGAAMPADCGTLVVPENRASSKSRLMPAGDPDPGSLIPPAAPIFYLNGGPGRTNMTFPQASAWSPSTMSSMVGYRGVDGLFGADCPEVTSGAGELR